MSYNSQQFRGLVGNVLRRVQGFYSKEAVELLLMTAAAESEFGTYLKQVGGPALGVMQVEPLTMRDNYLNFLDYRSDLRYELYIACGVSTPNETALVENLGFNILMARVKYYRDSDPIPATVEGMAKYHERVYNAGGSANWERSVRKYLEYCS